MKIVTDLDGVLRELNQYLEERFGVPYPSKWGWTFEGKNMFDFAREHPEMLFYSPKSKYFEVIINNLRQPVEIWSAQPESWRVLTKAWCDKNIGVGKYTIRFLETQEKHQKLNTESDILLIEDSPNFPEYSKIILIDMPYNQHIDAKIRINTPKELLKIIVDNLQ